MCRRERELERELSVVTEGLRDRAMERCVQRTLHVGVGTRGGQSSCRLCITHDAVVAARTLLPSPALPLPLCECSLQLEVPPGRDAGQTRTAAHKTHRKLTEERAAKVSKARVL